MDTTTLITTTLGPLPESALVKREGLVDNDNERTTTVEYCLINCSGSAHATHTPDSPSHFCNNHVHRSVHVTVKKIAETAGAASTFG